MLALSSTEFHFWSAWYCQLACLQFRKCNENNLNLRIMGNEGNKCPLNNDSQIKEIAWYCQLGIT
jgi:hypothetical protein